MLDTLKTREGITNHRARNARLEWRLNLLLSQELEVNMIMEEGMSLDLFRSLHSEATSRVAIKQTRQDTHRLGTELVSKAKGIVENLLVHFVRNL